MNGPMAFYQWVLFDNDGCLEDSVSAWVDAVQETSFEYGLKLSVEQVREQLGELLRVEQHGLHKDKILEYRAKVIASAREKAKTAPLFEGVKEHLHMLRSLEKQLGVVSTNQSGLEVSLRNHGIIDYFEVIVTGNDVRVKKPDPEGINFALRKMNADKRESIMVGDSWHDIAAANNAGIDSMLFHTKGHSGYHDLAQLRSHNPTYIVSSHAEAGTILGRTRAKMLSTL